MLDKDQQHKKCSRCFACLVWSQTC